MREHRSEQSALIHLRRTERGKAPHSDLCTRLESPNLQRTTSPHSSKLLHHLAESTLVQFRGQNVNKQAKQVDVHGSNRHHFSFKVSQGIWKYVLYIAKERKDSRIRSHKRLTTQKRGNYLEETCYAASNETCYAASVHSKIVRNQHKRDSSYRHEACKRYWKTNGTQSSELILVASFRAANQVQ